MTTQSRGSSGGHAELSCEESALEGSSSGLRLLAPLGVDGAAGQLSEGPAAGVLVGQHAQSH